MADTDKGQQCSCSATPLPPRSLRQTTIDIRIDFCPLHAAAPELLEITRLVAHPKFITDEHGSIRYYVTKSDVQAAREAIRKAEGK